MITIKSKDSDYGINFPEFIEEITVDDFNKILANVKIPKHYVVVALAFKTSLFNFCAAINKPAQKDLGVTPILAYIDEEDKESSRANVGDKITIVRSSLERGVHINLPVAITSINAATYLQTHKDIYTDILQIKNIHAKKEVYVLEFKIVPVTDIAASTDLTKESIDPFLVDMTESATN